MIGGDGGLVGWSGGRRKEFIIFKFSLRFLIGPIYEAPYPP
jgi:hypothetical protein